MRAPWAVWLGECVLSQDSTSSWPEFARSTPIRRPPSALSPLTIYAPNVASTLGRARRSPRCGFDRGSGFAAGRPAGIRGRWARGAAHHEVCSLERRGVMKFCHPRDNRLGARSSRRAACRSVRRSGQATLAVPRVIPVRLLWNGTAPGFSAGHCPLIVIQMPGLCRVRCATD